MNLSVGVLSRLIVTFRHLHFSNRSIIHYQTAAPLLECSPTTDIAVNPLRYYTLCPIIIDALSLDQ